jgi:hypothetical protein
MGVALAPAGSKGKYILLVGSDNDFITQDGHMAGRTYKDAAGADVDTLVMAWQVSLPSDRQCASRIKQDWSW